MRRTLPPLRLLTTFEAVLRTGGVQNAASELNVSQPAVSQALRSLEEYLGTRLLDRRLRPAVLTETGQILFSAVSSGINEIEAAVQTIKDREATDASVTTIACTICISTYWLMPRLAKFYGEHPDVTVRVVTSAGIPRFSPGVDLLIRYGSGSWSDGRSESLFQEKLLPVCSPRTYEQFGAGDFQRASLLDVEHQDDSWPRWESYFSATGQIAPERSRRIFQNYVQATEATVAGMGVMLGWVSNTGPLLSDGRLVAFRNEPFHPDGGYHLLKPNGEKAKRASRLLAEYLVRHATS